MAETDAQASKRIFPGEVFISSVLDAADTKSTMTRSRGRIFVMRSAMAGMLIGIFYLANYSVQAAFGALGANVDGVGRLVGALVFGFALVFIYFTRSELLTSNMMVTTIAVYYKRMGIGRMFKILGECLLGNALGGLLIAILVRFSTLISGTTGEYVTHSVDAKLGYIEAGSSGMLDLFVRAIFCNFMINVAMLLIYNGHVKSDGVKVAAMVVSVLLFAFLGFEHSVANTVLFLVQGVSVGVNWGYAAANVAIALIGNYIGGGLLIGAYYAYVNDRKRHLHEEG